MRLLACPQMCGVELLCKSIKGNYICLEEALRDAPVISLFFVHVTNDNPMFFQPNNYFLETNTWSQIHLPEELPAVRSLYNLIIYKNRLYILGGKGYERSAPLDFWSLCLDSRMRVTKRHNLF